MLARADEGRLPLSVEPVELGALAQRVGGRFAARAAQEGRALRIDGEAVRLSADPLRLDQALTNMIDNALRYGAGDVAVRTARSDGHAELHVTDDGAGFPPELEERAFDRFARADGGSTRAGAGLGLSIVAAIAARARRQRPRRQPPGGRRRRVDLAARRRLIDL